MTDASATDRLLHEALAALDRADEEPSDQLSEAAATALRAVVRLREALLDRPSSQSAPRPRVWLDATNVALSLISSVAYPAGKLDRSGLRQGRAALAALVEG
jgi:hypothetical protein